MKKRLKKLSIGFLLFAYLIFGNQSTYAIELKSGTPRLGNDVANVSTSAELIAEINDISNTPGGTKTIILNNDIVLTGQLNMNMNHGKNVIIKGNNKKVTLTAAPGAKHILLSGASATTLSIENVVFKGLIEDSRINAGLMDVVDVQNAPNAGGVVGIYGNGTINFKDVDFTRNKSARYTANASSFKVNALKATFENVNFIENFSGEGGPAILLNGGDGDNTEVVINNSSFIGNGVNSEGVAGGAVFIKNGSAPVTITNTVFEKNQLKSGNSSTTAPSGGGALALTLGTRSITIDSSIFNENTILAQNIGNGTTADGGGAYIYGTTGKIEVKNSTFTNNSALDEGGGLSAVLTPNTGNIIYNSTFVGNIARGDQTSDGADGAGGIELTGNYSVRVEMTLEHNTIYGNNALKGAATRNAGGGVSYYCANVISTNNIISGNIAETATDTTINEYKGSLVTLTTNNSLVDSDVAETFGLATPSLVDLGNKNVGSTTNLRTIMTLPIKPEGLADDKVTTTLTSDQNKNPRDSGTDLADLGAVEMKWVKYIANKVDSNWILPAITINNGSIYHQTENPDTLYLMYPVNTQTHNSYTKPIEPVKWLFINWNTLADGTGTGYEHNSSLTIPMNTNYTLYGKWDLVRDLSVTYDVNTGTGTTPVDNKLYAENEDVTVLDQGSIQKEGYTFVGWNTLADGTGTTYLAGETFTITESTVLFAKWEVVRNLTITYDANGGSGLVPTDATLYAKNDNVTVLDKNELVREGFTFAGWNTKADGTGVSYALNDTFAITENTILYAMWISDPVDPENKVVLPKTGGNELGMVFTTLTSMFILLGVSLYKRNF